MIRPYGRSSQTMGFMGVCIPEKYGGSGMDYNSLAILCEELERGDTAFRTAVSVHIGLNSMTLMQWGTEEQKQKYLIPASERREDRRIRVDGTRCRINVAAMATTAIRDGDEYVINGQKTGFRSATLQTISSFSPIRISRRSTMALVRSSSNARHRAFHRKRSKGNTASGQVIRVSFFLKRCDPC